MTVTIHIAGPNAGALAIELEAFFAEALGAVPERRGAPAAAGTQRGDLADYAAVAALVLALPGAITATLDLAVRARLAERADRLLERLRGLAGAGDSVSLSAGTALPLDLTRAGRDELLDRLERPTDTD
ncbi:hypothetical protein FBZ83_109192 [Azospirillum brasilense]|uniref:Uncharacterized protein n=1 Tax=Azospirillum brasilense TaxID=192 RepID=A0A560C6A6_AZOBR|nr:hypothetical protein [Azospirillum brasilense]TWA80386.1 hypothetical protein FBZ83_109192 [Azospirillum brasilense]